MNEINPTVETVKVTPAVGWFASHFAGFSLPDYINLCMAVYATYLAISSVNKFYRWWRHRKVRAA
jgi:hypothetical protein